MFRQRDILGAPELERYFFYFILTQLVPSYRDKFGEVFISISALANCVHELLSFIMGGKKVRTKLKEA